MKACTWEGYGGGASYPDRACCGGELGDLDDGPHGYADDGSPMIGLTGEICPQCDGTGEIEDDAIELGPMAFLRQRAREELQDHIDILADRTISEEDAADAKVEIDKHIDGIFKLINKLESQDCDVKSV